MRFSIGCAAAALLISGQAQAAIKGGYDCTADAPYAVNVDGDKVSGSKIEFGDGFPKDAWQFDLSVDAENAKINWPNSPIQVSGEGPIIPTSKQSFFTFSLSGSPCLFTEGNCGAMIDFVEQPDGGLLFSIRPSAISRLPDGSREPLPILINGSCSKEADAE